MQEERALKEAENAKMADDVVNIFWLWNRNKWDKFSTP